MAKKKKSQKPAKSFEQNLWDTADKLRGKVESSEYKACGAVADLPEVHLGQV